MMKAAFQFVAIAGFLSLFSCGKEIESMKSFYGWINDPDNGLVKTRTIEGIRLTVKYLPAEFLALRDAMEETDYSSHVYDSLLGIYRTSHTFLLSIASEKDEHNVDPMYKGLESLPEYKERALTMNFNMDSYVSIRTPSEEYRPVLTSMENTYSLKAQRNIYIVFTDDSEENNLMKEQELDFIFNDEIFQTGINHFVFRQKDLANTPTVNFDNIK